MIFFPSLEGTLEDGVLQSTCHVEKDQLKQ